MQVERVLYCLHKYIIFKGVVSRTLKLSSIVQYLSVAEFLTNFSGVEGEGIITKCLSGYLEMKFRDLASIFFLKKQ